MNGPAVDQLHEHLWVPKEVEEDGSPHFAPFMGPTPVTYVFCTVCGVRTWFTREQWNSLNQEQQGEEA